MRDITDKQTIGVRAASLTQLFILYAVFTTSALTVLLFGQMLTQPESSMLLSGTLNAAEWLVPLYGSAALATVAHHSGLYVASVATKRFGRLYAAPSAFEKTRTPILKLKNRQIIK